MEINWNMTPFTWGVNSLDRAFWKPDYRELITLFWYMSAWKTEFTYFMARKNVENWQKVCYISLELPEYDMKLRVSRKWASVKKIDFQNGNYSDTQKYAIEDTFQKLEDTKNLFLIKPETNDVWWIEKSIREHYDLWCRLFIIDNLDKITWDDNDNTRYMKISSSLQDLKNESKICIILIHHSKKPQNRQVQYLPAGMSGIRWSQKVLDNSTQVIEIRRDLDPDITDKIEKSKVYFYQYKDTFEWGNWQATVYFHKWDYYEQIQEEKPF